MNHANPLSVVWRLATRAVFAVALAVPLASNGARPDVSPASIDPGSMGSPSGSTTAASGPGALGGARQLFHVDASRTSIAGKALRKGMHPVRIDAAELDDWTPGIDGEFALPDGRHYAIRAARVETHPSGNRTWVGKLEANGRTYVSVVTYGAGGVAGEIRTPDGPLLLTTENGETMLVDTESAGWQLPANVEPDVRVPMYDQLLPAPGSEQPVPADKSAIDQKAAPSPQTTIDVMIAYTHGMVTRAGSTAAALVRLDQLVATSNQAYIDSEVAITLRLVYSLEVDYTETDDNGTALDNLTNGAGVFSTVATTLRTRYGADIVALVRPFNYPANGGCGIAWIGGYNNNGPNIGGQSNAGFAVVSDGSDVNGSGYFCQAATFPHELAHTMGAMHDRATVTQGGTQTLGVGAYSYSYGYVHNATFSLSQGANVCNAGAGTSCFGTIMSYLTKVSELKFSNPNISTCPTGLVCGDANDNVALTLNNTRAGVASWRAAKVPFVGATSGSGQSAAPGAGFAQPLKLTIRDAASAVVPGVIVNFSAPASGASASLSSTSVVTDANGVAQVSASANGTSGSYTVTATATSGLVAAPFTFALTNGTAAGAASLTVTVNGSGSVTGGGLNCPGTCSINPAAGSVVTLLATPASGMVFTGWLGDVCTGTGGCSVTVNAAKSVSATFAPTGTLPLKLDVDANNQYDALTDGVLVVRYLFGLSGSALTAGAVGAGAQRTSASAIASFLANVAPQLDVDGNGQADALTDGVLIVRYLFGLRGASLVGGALGPGATRTSATQIESYIAARLP
jgi:hypothetical protein